MATVFCTVRVLKKHISLATHCLQLQGRIQAYLGKCFQILESNQYANMWVLIWQGNHYTKRTILKYHPYKGV